MNWYVYLEDSTQQQQKAHFFFQSYGKAQTVRTDKTILSKKNKVGGNALSDNKAYYIARVIKCIIDGGIDSLVNGIE